MATLILMKRIEVIAISDAVTIKSFQKFPQKTAKINSL